MNQPIIGFDQDELGDWRAVLACGHRMHVRHNPPLIDRPWVLSPEGRARFVGTLENCKACDEGEPAGDREISAAAVAIEDNYAQFGAALARLVAIYGPEGAAQAGVLQAIYRAIHERAADSADPDSAAIVRDVVSRHAGSAIAPDRLAEAIPSLSPLIACLPGVYRQALILTEERGLSSQELADRLDLPPTAAEARLREARAQMREALLDYCHFEFDRLGRVLDFRPGCPVCLAGTLAGG